MATLFTRGYLVFVTGRPQDYRQIIMSFQRCLRPKTVKNWNKGRNMIWERFTQKRDFAWFCHAENEVFVLTSLAYKEIEAPEPITFLESWDIVCIKK